ncbi:hypothetical protein [Paenibacillus thiaminolyticus]|uniref:hypothetical protein n=1 Tax=Paenibacillus thiaminolyticus TaxID=49283 RepID=UPI0011C3D719|nr:hypothetical protein [Paenibacillus thiaminolyticus]
METDGFDLISSLPSGDIQAGSVATVSLKPLPGKDEADTNPMEVSFRMPDRPDANYLLSIEMVRLRAKLVQLIRFFWLISARLAPKSLQNRSFNVIEPTP